MSILGMNTGGAMYDDIPRTPSNEDLESGISNEVLSKKDIGEVIMPRSPSNDYGELSNHGIQR